MTQTKQPPIKPGRFSSYFCGPFAPACAAAGTYDYQRAHGVRPEDARKAALAAAISTYATQKAGGYADVGKYGKAFTTAYAGGYVSSRINGGDGVRGGTVAVVQLGLKVAMDQYAGHNSKLDPAQSDAVVKTDKSGVLSPNVANTGGEIIAPEGSKYVGKSLSELSQEDLAELAKIEDNVGKIIQVNGIYKFSWDSEGGAFMSGISQNLPRVNAFSIFHDNWMLTQGVQNPIMLAVTIPPAAYLQYCALGVCTQYYVTRTGRP